MDRVSVSVLLTVCVSPRLGATASWGGHRTLEALGCPARRFIPSLLLALFLPVGRVQPLVPLTVQGLPADPTLGPHVLLWRCPRAAHAAPPPIKTHMREAGGSLFFGFSTHPTLCSQLRGSGCSWSPAPPRGHSQGCSPSSSAQTPPVPQGRPPSWTWEHSVLCTSPSVPALVTWTCRDVCELPAWVGR